MTYNPPWTISMAPYYRGYSIMKQPRIDRWEIWNYATDRLVHTTRFWAEAKAWADQNAIDDAEHDWNHLALY